MRAGELTTRPVVTLDGDLAAEVKDVVFDRGAGRVEGFTLNNHGLFSRSRHDALLWGDVYSLGADAVMIRGDDVFVPMDHLASRREQKSANVLADQVLTDGGLHLGTVVDVILEVGAQADVIGYEIEASENLSNAGVRMLIPVPAALAISGEKLIVPASAAEFVSTDLAGFGAAVDAFREKLAASGPSLGSAPASKEI
jgi:uncharacterized protein YrrD